MKEMQKNERNAKNHDVVNYLDAYIFFAKATEIIRQSFVMLLAKKTSYVLITVSIHSPIYFESVTT